MLDIQQTLFRIVIAAAAGSVIGVERERLRGAAGLPTHRLVWFGSCRARQIKALPFVVSVEFD